jgi:transposase-like protein
MPDHFMVNLLNQVPKRTRTFAATLVRSIYDNKEAKEVLEQHQRAVGQLEERFPEATAMLDEAAPDVLAFTAFPVERLGRNGPTIPRNGSTGRSGEEQTWSAFFPTGGP